jgi:DNA-binding MarR family transcriptional regulator
VQELAEQLQLRHHSVVELINRAQRQGLVDRGEHPHNGRAVRVFLTVEGERVLARLSALHREQLRTMEAVLTPPTWGERSPRA